MDYFYKNNRWVVLGLLFSVIMVTSLFLPAPWLMGQSEWAHEKSDLEPDDEVVWGRLDNGLRYAFLPNREPPGKVSLRLYVNAGSLMETDDQQGLAHFLEHMAFNGTRNFAPGEMVEYFQRLGMAFGADNNAYTGFDATVYILELPENSEPFLEDGLKVLRDYADGLLLLEAEIERERGIVLSEQRDRDSVRYREFVAQWEFLFPESRVSKRFPIGKESVIREAQRERFVDFYENWYTPERMVVVAVGDVEADTLVPLIEEYFSDGLLADHRPDPDKGPIVHPGVTALLHTDSEAQSTSISIHTVQPYSSEGDTRAMRVRDFYLAVANQALSHRLSVLSKEANAPFYKGYAYAFDMLSFFEVGGIKLFCPPAQWRETLVTAELELRRAVEFGFTQAEIQAAGAKIINELEQQVKTASTRQSRRLAEALVGSISDNKVFTHPNTDLEIAQEAFGAAGPEEYLKAFHDLWQNEDRYIFASGDLELENAEAVLIETFEASKSVAVDAPIEAQTSTFAYTDFGQPGETVEEVWIEDLDIYQFRFANNVRLNLKRTDFEDNVIYVGARFGSGKLEALPDKEGLALLASSAFIGGGLVEHSADDLAQILAGKNVGVEFAVEDDAWLLKGQTGPEDLLLQLQLMCAYLVAPGYREEALRLARKSFDPLYRQLMHTAEGVVRDQVRRFLASGDFRFGFPSKEAAMERTLEELRTWMQEPLEKSYLEVSIVGDFDLEAVKKAMVATFGALPERLGAKPRFLDARKIQFPETPGAEDFFYMTELPRSVAALYWSTTDLQNIGLSRRLNLLSRVFSDRLRLQLREESGKAYSPYAVSEPSDTYIDYGFFYALTLTEPDDIEAVTEQMRSIGVSLQREGLTEDEFQRARKPMLTFIEEYVRKNSYWLNTVLMKSQESPERLEWARTFKSDYESITLDQLNEVADEYLKSEQAISIQVLPEKE